MNTELGYGGGGEEYDEICYSLFVSLLSLCWIRVGIRRESESMPKVDPSQTPLRCSLALTFPAP